MTHKYGMGVKENGKKIVEIIHVWDYYKVDNSIKETLNAALQQIVTDAVNQTVATLAQGKTP